MSWELKKEDALTAFNYLHRAIKDFRLFDTIDDNKALKAIKEFDKVKELFYADSKQKDFYSILKAFIATYLNEQQLNRLRTKLRVENSRKRKNKRNITLDDETHYKLQIFAKEHNVTLSQAIEMLLDKN